MPALTLQPLQPRDERRAIDFAVTGMHFDWYMDNRWLQRLYGRYFWYKEKARATQVLAAYADGALAGVLLARFDGEPPASRSCGAWLYVRLWECLQAVFAKGSAGVYETANEQMFAQYRARCAPDGEILFLAADPARRVPGVGRLLLDALARPESGKTVYLFTDSACTYSFYDRHGFTRACQQEAALTQGHKRVRLQCFLYSKTL